MNSTSERKKELFILGDFDDIEQAVYMADAGYSYEVIIEDIDETLKFHTSKNIYK